MIRINEQPGQPAAARVAIPAACYSRLLRRPAAALRWLERVFVAVAALMLLAIMLIATADVAMRYLFNAPLGWSYDLISMYLMAGLFFFSLSDTLHKHVHVAVDLLHARMEPRTRHVALVPGYALAVLVLGTTAWLGWNRTLESFLGGDVIAGRFDWPTWIALMFVALGFTLLSLRVVVRFIGHALSALTGREFIELPPVSGQGAHG